MPRIFAERGLTANGNLLPFEDFVLYRDLKGERKPDPEKLAAITARAEKYLSEDVPMLPLSLYREFFVNGNRSDFENPYHKRRAMMEALAIAEHYEGKGRFAEKLADALWAILEESTWVYPAHTAHIPVYGAGYSVPSTFGDRLHGIDLGSASTAAQVAMAWYLCHDALDAVSPMIGERLLYELDRRAVKPYLNAVFGWSGERGNRVNNWNPYVHVHLLTVTALVVKDPYLRGHMTGKIMSLLDNFVKFYSPDGGCDEGPGYFGMAGGCYFDALELLYDMSGGKIDVFDHPLVRAIGEYEVKFNIAGDRFINFADCGAQFVTDGARLVRFGERTGSEILVSFGNSQMALGGSPGGLTYCGLRDLLTKTPEKTVQKAATKIWFPDLKVMAARESEDPTKGMFVAMKGGNNNESHNHNDVGNVIVYHDGNPVLIDSGVGTYTKQTFSSRRYELWYMQSSYHNLPDIGGVAERAGGQYCSASEEYDQKSGGVRMEIGGAYPKEAGILSYTRETVLADGTVTVTDRISLSEEKEIDFHFLSPVKPEGGDGVIRLAEGRTMTYDPTLTLAIEEFKIGDGRLEKSWKSDVLWRISLKTTVKAGTFLFKIH